MADNLKHSLSLRVADTLEEKVGEGRWKVVLPGIRVLCDEMGVSSRTMMMALRILENRGVLDAAEKGKPRALKTGFEQTQQEKKQLSVCVLMWRKLEDLSLADRDIVNHFRQEIQEGGGEVNLLVYHEVVKASGGNKIAEVIERNPADGYMVVGAHLSVSEVLVELGVPVAYVGGEHVKGAVPRAGYSMSGMCSEFLEEMVKLGHERCITLLPGVMVRHDEGLSHVEEAIGRVYWEHGLRFVAHFHCPRWGSGLSDLQAGLDKLFRLTPPTALILGDASMVPGVVSFLMQRGLRYPEDVSIACLDGSEALKHFVPPISHITKMGKSGGKRMFRLLQQRMELRGEMSNEVTILPCGVVMTDSLVGPKGG